MMGNSTPLTIVWPGSTDMGADGGEQNRPGGLEREEFGIWKS